MSYNFKILNNKKVYSYFKRNLKKSLVVAYFWFFKKKQLLVYHSCISILRSQGLLNKNLKFESKILFTLKNRVKVFSKHIYKDVIFDLI